MIRLNHAQISFIVNRTVFVLVPWVECRQIWTRVFWDYVVPKMIRMFSARTYRILLCTTVFGNMLPSSSSG